MIKKEELYLTMCAIPYVKSKYLNDMQSEKIIREIEYAIDETAKYPVKDTDYMTDDKERNLQIIKDLEERLYRKRLLSYGGLLKEVQ